MSLGNPLGPIFLRFARTSFLHVVILNSVAVGVMLAFYLVVALGLVARDDLWLVGLVLLIPLLVDGLLLRVWSRRARPYSAQALRVLRDVELAVATEAIDPAIDTGLLRVAWESVVGPAPTSAAGVGLADLAPPGIDERGGGRALIALVGSVLIVVFAAAMAVALWGGSAIASPGEIQFGTGRSSDFCEVAGQRALFGPDDPIFYAAPLNHPGEPGAWGVINVERDGQILRSDLISLWHRPSGRPSDCISGIVDWPILDPGVYVLRIRDGSRPASTPDLASGTFTVTGSVVP